MAASERMRELRRRRARKAKYLKFKKKLATAAPADKAAIAEKLWKMTPAAPQVIAQLGLAET